MSILLTKGMTAQAVLLQSTLQPVLHSDEKGGGITGIDASVEFFKQSKKKTIPL